VTREDRARLESLKDIADFAALFRAPTKASCIWTLGPEKWQAHVEVRGTTYRIDVARYARRECPWSWEISSEGVHVRGGDERTLEEVETWLSEALMDLWAARP
jgi:hypothetical protein